MPVLFSEAAKDQIAEEVAKCAITFAVPYYAAITQLQQEKVTAALKTAVVAILVRHEPLPVTCPFKAQPAGA